VTCVDDKSLAAVRLPLFPMTTTVLATPDGKRLAIGGCRLDLLATTHGTPLYLYDQPTMDAAVVAYQRALADHYPAPSALTLAGKAFLCVAGAQWAAQAGLWLDCTGAGEIGVAVAAGFPRARLLVHGVNKSDEDLEAAISHAAVIVVDNASELDRLAQRRQAGAQLPNLWLRFRPGMAVETHAYRQTGQLDSKFGLDEADLLAAIAFCRLHGLPLTGLHFHQGSHFHDPAPIGPALDAALDLCAAAHAEFDWMPEVLCPGGGWGVAYHEGELPHPRVADYVAFVAGRLTTGAVARGLPLPRLQFEPGRSLVAQAGVALYRVGAIKQTPQRRYLLIDGGMSDNPRPALYGARYSALPVQAPERPATGAAWLAGPFCESGDILIHDLPLPDVAPGEVLAVPASGAYHLNMGSNYNGARRPAVLWLRGGEAHLIQRRETIAELLQRDLPLPG
jgi:diaminopimelate decarboxylase